MSVRWQVPLEKVSNRDWPVVVVGCGPAGAVAAVHLARRGIRVLVVEKGQFPRDKVCGDALMPDAVRALERAGAADAVREQATAARRLVVYSPSRHSIDIDSPTLTIRRCVLDQLLAGTAARAGAVIAQGDVREIESDGRQVRLGLARTDSKLTASIVLLATGADVRLLRRVATLASEQPTAIAVRRLVHSSVPLDHLIVSFDRSILPGYAWLFPLPDCQYNVGCGTAYARASGQTVLEKRLDAFLREFPAAHEVMEGASSVGPLQGAVLRAGARIVRRMHVPNVLPIGESVGTTLPLTGEGIGKAMETGERAAEIVAAALSRGVCNVARDFANYLTTLRPLYDAYRTGERWLAYPWLNDAVIRVACRSPYARRAIAEIIDETADPAAIFSLGGIARVLTS